MEAVGDFVGPVDELGVARWDGRSARRRGGRSRDSWRPAELREVERDFGPETKYAEAASYDYRAASRRDRRIPKQ